MSFACVASALGSSSSSSASLASSLAALVARADAAAPGPWTAATVLVSRDACAEPELAVRTLRSLLQQKQNQPAVLGVVHHALRQATSSHSHSPRSLEQRFPFSGIQLLKIVLPPNLAVSAFYDGGSSRQRNKAVGRWLPRLAPKETVDVAEFTSVSLSNENLHLPQELARLHQAVSSPSHKSWHSIQQPFFLLAADDSQQTALRMLDVHFPYSHKFGWIGSGTPFVNGNPFTLMVNDEVYAGGIAGISIYPASLLTENQDEKKEKAKTVQGQDILRVQTSIHYSCKPIGPPLTITGARGNIIMDLDSKNPTRYLLELLNKNTDMSLPAAKETPTYLGLYRSKSDAEAFKENMHVSDTHFKSVSRITSGDPMRGQLALDTAADLARGQYVQTMYHPPETIASGPGVYAIPEYAENKTAALTTNDNHLLLKLITGMACNDQVATDNDHSSSGNGLDGIQVQSLCDNGLIWSQMRSDGSGKVDTSICRVPGTSATLSLFTA